MNNTFSLHQCHNAAVLPTYVQHSQQTPIGKGLVCRKAYCIISCICLFHRWSHIHCASATPLADKGVNRGAHRINGLANGEKCPTTKMVNGSGEPETSHKGKDNCFHC